MDRKNNHEFGEECPDYISVDSLLKVRTDKVLLTQRCLIKFLRKKDLHEDVGTVLNLYAYKRIFIFWIFKRMIHLLSYSII